MEDNDIDLGQEENNAPNAVTPENQEVENQEVEKQENVDESSSDKVTKSEDDLPRGIKKRFDKLTKEKYELQHDIEQLKNYIRQQEEKKNEKPRSEYTDEQWYEHKAELKAKELFDSYRKQEEQQIVAQRVAEQRRSDWEKKVNSFSNDIPDFNEVLAQNADIQIPREVLRTIAESDVGPKIAYHLAKNPNDAEKLWNMDDRARDRFITRLEVRLEDKSFANKEITKASPTPKSKGGSSSNNNMENLSIDEWMKQRNKKVRG